MSLDLTRDCLRSIIKEGREISRPIVQVLQIGEPKTKGTTIVYRAALSDGSFFTSAFFNSNLTPLIESKKISLNTVIQLDKYNITNSRLVVLEVTVLSTLPTTVGDPKKLSDDNHQQAESKPMVPAAVVTSTPHPKPSASAAPLPTPQGNIVSIERLTSYLSQWTILGKIVKKGNMRKFGQNNSVFNVIIQDKDGCQIQGSFFGQTADNWYDKLDVGKVYIVNGGRLKLVSNRRYNSTKHDYEISFDNSTTFNEVADDHSIGDAVCHYTPIDKIKDAKYSVDAIGRIIQIDEPSTFVAKKTGKDMTKRRIVIVDTSNAQIEVTLWDSEATTFAGTLGDILSIKDASISEFNGKALSVSLNSTMRLNPQCAEATAINKWWENGGSEQSHESLSTGSGVGGDYGPVPDVFLKLINDRHYGTSETKADYFQSYVVVNEFTTRSKPFYLTCPNSKCPRKAVELQQDGMYFCKSCRETTSQPVPKPKLSFRIADYSGSTYCSLVGDDVMMAKITGRNAEQWAEVLVGKDDMSGEMDYLKQYQFKQFKLKLRAKADSYDGQIRPKVTLVKAEELNFAEGANFYAQEIRKYG